ncbi:type II toxin-antitoxin system VapB family antitoxin [Sphingomonas floccifaciens]|uniref:Type II toxin-antitoxin system VapB family antitoxin n=1 Tax=Sphingomonas floccifaciens TaxID=1844115 RepID=A0ABW4NCQ0_9SPHN
MAMINVDDRLITEAMIVMRKQTKREAVEKALQDAIRVAKQHEILSYRGKLTSWEGDLNALRTD